MPAAMTVSLLVGLSGYKFTANSVLKDFWATVASSGSPYATGPLSCLSATLVYCDQTVGWMTMPLATEVDLGPGDIVLDGDPAPLPRKGAQQPPHFSVHVYVAKRSPMLATSELLFHFMQTTK